MYFLVNIHINNQSTLYKVNGVLCSTLNHIFCPSIGYEFSSGPNSEAWP
jgi:hypothetical protein